MSCLVLSCLVLSCLVLSCSAFQKSEGSHFSLCQISIQTMRRISEISLVPFPTRCTKEVQSDTYIYIYTRIYTFRCPSLTTIYMYIYTCRCPSLTTIFIYIYVSVSLLNDYLNGYIYIYIHCRCPSLTTIYIYAYIHLFVYVPLQRQLDKTIICCFVCFPLSVSLSGIRR